MLMGLSGGSTATVSAGRGGSTTITQAGKPTVMVLPGTLAITARPGTVKPKPTAAPAAAVASVAGALGKLDPKKTLLILGGLGVVVWGAIKLGVFKSGRRGARRRRNPRRARYARNPRGGLKAEYEDPDVKRAVDFRKSFHWGYPARAISQRRVSPQPRVIVELGEVKSITYKTNKQGERAKFFVHDFESKRPTLGMDIRNKRLHFVGGGYTVTDDGITG